MNEGLQRFSITPRVLKADALQTVSICGLDESYTFYDDIDYLVKITPLNDGWGYFEDKEFVMRGRDNSETITCRSENGVLKIEYFFKGEGEWTIHIAPGSDKHVPEDNIKYGWAWRTNSYMNGFGFKVYTLKEDLYKKRPFKGDLHVHTWHSDGAIGAKTVVAQYRRFGFDFMTISDHNKMQPSLDAIEAYQDIPTAIKIFPGEEVHPVPSGIFHVVNFGGKASVNERVQKDFVKADAEVEAIAKTLTDIEDPLARKEVAWFQWIHEAIHETGGLSIYAHPYWTVFDSYVVRQPVNDEVMKRKLMDVYEFYGGNPPKINKLQAQLYYQYSNSEKKIPVVASSDSHSAYAHDENFDAMWTIVFAEDVEKISESIMANGSVAVDNFDPKQKNVYGDLRLVKYTWFLLENYYFMHDELCNAAGQAILRHVLGHAGQEELIRMLEAEVVKYNESFFGK